MRADGLLPTVWWTSLSSLSSPSQASLNHVTGKSVVFCWWECSVILKCTKRALLIPAFASQGFYYLCSHFTIHSCVLTLYLCNLCVSSLYCIAHPKSCLSPFVVRPWKCILNITHCLCFHGMTFSSIYSIFVRLSGLFRKPVWWLTLWSDCRPQGVHVQY